jgi:aryl carrier-like protein
LDRKTLPAPDFKRPDFNGTFAAPRTAVEKKLAELCVEILKIDKVGIHDNLFDLGLHSLSATQLVSRVRVVRVNLPLRHILRRRRSAWLS